MKTRVMFLSLLLAIVTLGVIVQFIVIINLTRINSELYARRFQIADNQSVARQIYSLRREALTRAALYDQLIQKDFLVDGMVVHRDVNGAPTSLCDSLEYVRH